MKHLTKESKLLFNQMITSEKRIIKSRSGNFISVEYPNFRKMKSVSLTDFLQKKMYNYMYLCWSLLYLCASPLKIDTSKSSKVCVVVEFLFLSSSNVNVTVDWTRVTTNSTSLFWRAAKSSLALSLAIYRCLVDQTGDSELENVGSPTA